ncbi:hypothetical protein B0A49_02782 [Cryomyces minteri]|uniref:Cytidyltransferase-like domain-containing protein n=1 Tax=Cryomyces minteri TaxID=331657 RepID=A0A4U0XBT4_9PEZI|nr:hypothetical protein B0A49_06204 [Cryomyces minteri]TKA77555.1 hypothetical protein B0A49_02782 [Cryomyces minteri]
MADSADSPSFLLLLPSPQSSLSFTALKTAYAEDLTQVLKEAAGWSSESSQAAILDIAVACTNLKNSYAGLVSDLYKLICVIAAKESINVEDADGVDVRIVLLVSDMLVPTNRTLQGPLIDLETVARSGRQWQFVFGSESEDGQKLMQNFLAVKNGHHGHGHGHGHGPEQVDEAASRESRPERAPLSGGSNGHLSVAVGGTFDHLHIGHKLLLTMTALALVPEEATTSERCLTVGITGDELLKKKRYREVLESWDDRQKSVWRFLKAIMDFRAPGEDHVEVEEKLDSGPNGHAVHIRLGQTLTIKCVEIWDPFGPTITEESITALVLSAETRAGGEAVNEKRAELGWPGLEVFEVDVLDAQEDTDRSTASSGQPSSFESKISSTEIRKKLWEKSTGKV